jgi:hypothetical protein
MREIMSSNKVYVLGAGFSMAVSDGNPHPYKMPSMQGLSEGVSEYLKLNRRRLIPTAAEETAYELLKKLLHDVGETDHRFTVSGIEAAARQMNLANSFPGIDSPLVDNFEQWLSFLIESPPWLTPADQARNRAAFLDIAKGVGYVLEGCQRATIRMQNSTCPEWLMTLVRHWEANAATVITFNYDRFVELAWTLNIDPSKPRQWSWDLYPVPVTPLMVRSGNPAHPVHCAPGGFQLFKLHGSLGWWYTGPDGPPGDIIYDQGMEGQAWSDGGLAPVGGPSFSFTEDREQMIVPPAAVKSPYYNNAALRMMWRYAAAYLARADELVIMGFSLPTTDMLVSSMLSMNLRQTCTITVVDSNPEIVSRVRAVFGMKNDASRLNTDYVKYGNDAIPRWVEENVKLG